MLMLWTAKLGLTSKHSFTLNHFADFKMWISKATTYYLHKEVYWWFAIWRSSTSTVEWITCEHSCIRDISINSNCFEMTNIALEFI